MTVEIGDLLNRRSDLSTFLVHLTKGPDPKANLLAMLGSFTIEARSVMGWAKEQAPPLGPRALASQLVVCLSETPLDQIYMLFQPIRGRQVPLSAYGLAFPKAWARVRGVNPVWYVDMSVGRQWELALALNTMRDAACANGEQGFLDSPASKVFPFVEGMGTWHGTRKEFWWEREWRHRGPFSFNWMKMIVLAPEASHEEVSAAAYGRPVIDPGWSLERIIGSLARLDRDDLSVFG